MFNSNAEWPAHTYTNEFGQHVSTDTHETKDQAQAVCDRLEKEGFALDGTTFPIKTWVD